MKLERYSRSARRLHTAVYLLTLFLLATGWWLLVGREGEPSPVARLLGVPDAALHVWVGWGLAIAALLPLVLARRGVAAFMRETLRRDPGDLGWLLRWPLAIVTGRFARHEGHFDPGQRIANVAIVGLLVALIASGIGLVLVHFGLHGGDRRAHPGRCGDPARIPGRVAIHASGRPGTDRHRSAPLARLD